MNGSLKNQKYKQSKTNNRPSSRLNHRRNRIFPMSSSVKVAVRLRPMNSKEESQGTLPVVTASSVDNNITTVRGNGRGQQRSCYHFDAVFSSFTTQEHVFDSMLKPVINDVMNGFESTVFAYGQTGTGKTYTMEGDLSNPDSFGVIPRSTEKIFEVLKRPEYIFHEVTVSYLEIYNEELCDLLSEGINEHTSYRSSPKNLHGLNIMESKDGVVCRGLTTKVVNSAADVLAIMTLAQKQRKIGETKMNKKSSRSHCVFTISLSAKKQLEAGHIFDTRGKLHLVDLAGSECAKATSYDYGAGRSEIRDDVSRERGRERSNINKSLLTLGRVIIMLNDQSNNKKSSQLRIPYRDSKLTRILQNSLGGTCKTLIIATVSPSVLSIEETMSTLNYAQSACGIINKPVAVSYLSIGSGSRPTTPSSELHDIRGVQNWQEMEMRMEYLQSQVAEAQTALALKYEEQKSLIDRAEKAEEVLAETQRKLEQSELNLKKTTIILEATKETEQKLTSEATELMKMLDFSIQDGNKLYSMLQEARNADIERREATKNFHASVLGHVDFITEKLGNLKVEGEVHHSTAIKLAEDHHKQEHKELDASVQLFHEIQLLVSNLTMIMKSHVNDENGIIDILSKLSENVHDNIEEAKNQIETGEKHLISSIESIREDLKSHSAKLLDMEKEYVSVSTNFSQEIESMLSETNKKLGNMVSSATEALLRAKEESSRTRESLTKSLASFHATSTASITKIHDQSQRCSEGLTKGLQSFTVGMAHLDEIHKDLIQQKDYIKSEGTAHLNKIDEQQKMVQEQNEYIFQAKFEQKRNEQMFVQQLLQGVADLVNEQMNFMSSKHEENLASLEEGNKVLSTFTDGVKSSVYDILKEIKATNESIYIHSNEALSNDRRMKNSIENTQEVLGKVEMISRDQRETESLFMDDSYKHINVLTEHEQAVTTTSTMLLEDGIQTEEFIRSKLSTDMQDGMKRLSLLVDNKIKFANTAFNTTNQQLETTMSPRANTMQSFLKSSDTVRKSFHEGRQEIEDVSGKHSNIADELRCGVEKESYRFRNEVAKKWREDIGNHKNNFVEKSQDFKHNSTEAISQCVSIVSNAKSSLDEFATKTINTKDEIPPLQERERFKYKKTLSSTPPESQLVKRVIKETQ